MPEYLSGPQMKRGIHRAGTGTQLCRSVLPEQGKLHGLRSLSQSHSGPLHKKGAGPGMSGGESRDVGDQLGGCAVKLRSYAWEMWVCG